MPCPSMGPNNFGWVQIVWDKPNLLWSGPNHFEHVQIIKISPEKYNLNPTKMIWTWLKWFGPGIKKLNGPKSFWTYRRTGHNSREENRLLHLHEYNSLFSQWLTKTNFLLVHFWPMRRFFSQFSEVEKEIM